ncbi:hypothetical protein [Novosphingobium barchaimii]|uniref:hypothetical protein n=1 Tax=Novosphingobium barchaimii TaxID=1420591 RepID=UPI0014707513|nr:hypothetical protein [Novosphingobium barchaimii]
MGYLVARLAPGTTGAICAQMAGSSHTCRLALGALLIFAAFLGGVPSGTQSIVS